LFVISDVVSSFFVSEPFNFACVVVDWFGAMDGFESTPLCCSTATAFSIKISYEVLLKFCPFPATKEEHLGTEPK